MRRTAIAAIVTGLALTAPAVASADSYYMSRGQAQRNARDAAETLYGETHGISYDDSGAWCRPQGAARAKPGYDYHRWVCTWVGRDYDGDMANGQLRITGHSGNRYGYRVLHGINWDA